MCSVVLDASAAVELLLGTPAGAQANAALRGRAVAVPVHFDAEVLSALGHLARTGYLEADLVEPLLGQLARAPFVRYALRPLLVAAWGLRHDLAPRDAMYVILARRLGATLLTADSRLAQAPGLGGEVALVGGG